MNLPCFDNGAKFQKHVLPYLMEREAEHNLILGIVAGIASGTEWLDPPPYLALVEDEGRTVAVAVMTPPHNLLLSHIERLEALRLLLADLLSSSYGVPGVTASPPVAEAFAVLWQEGTGRQSRLAMAQRIYQLDQVRPPAGVPGSMRRAVEGDRPLLEEWIAAFYRETGAGGGDPDAAVDKALTQKSRGLYLWEDGEPVSMAGYVAGTPNGVRIGAVYTPPEKRRRGYASACVAALSQMLLERGRRFCFLYTDLANPTSNHIYQEIGYRPVADSVMLRFEDDD